MFLIVFVFLLWVICKRNFCDTLTISLLCHVRSFPDFTTRESRNQAIAACETASIPAMGHEIVRTGFRKVYSWPFREVIEIEKQQLSWDLQRMTVSFWGQFCWWFRNPAWKPVEVGSSSHYLQGFYIPGGVGFLPSTVWSLKKHAKIWHLARLDWGNP